MFRERIMPGSFQRAITEDDVRSAFNHNWNLILGRNTAGTLEMREDGTGLWYGVNMPDTQYAHDLLDSVKRGDVSQCSFTFRIGAELWEEFDDETLPRASITEVNPLYEVGPVVFPQYESTDVVAAALGTEEQAARRLRLAREGGALVTPPDPAGVEAVDQRMRERAATLARRYNPDDRPFIRAALQEKP